MSRNSRSERALRKDVDRLARSKTEAPSQPDRVIVPYSPSGPDADDPVVTEPSPRPLEPQSGRVGAGVHIVEMENESTGGSPRS